MRRLSNLSSIDLYYILNIIMHKLIIIFALVHIIIAPTGPLCSGYCATCNATVCSTCPTNFTLNITNGCSYTASYNVVYEQAVAANFTLNVTCGTILVVGTNPNVNISLLTNNPMAPHYKIRVRVAIIWLNATFLTNDAISIWVDGTSKASSQYSVNTTTNTSCNAVNQKSYGIDTN